MKSRSPLCGVFKFLYTHNPFYLISACLVLYGIHEAFHPQSGDYIDPWALMSSLCGYTLLLAVTAFLIIRFGNVWDDARSIVLILLLLFLVVSVSFDEIVNLHPDSGRKLLLFGFGFAAVISEGLLRGLRIRFPALLRIPYYLTLALFFLYPLYVSPEVNELTREATRWRMLLFPSAAGLIFLGLLPAIRRGSAWNRDNGTPWKWPWFPWAAFAVLAIGVCVRTYILSVSFELSRGYASTFGGYFIVPFVFVVLLLLMEIGLKERLPRLLKTVSAIVPLVVLLSMPFETGNLIAEQFLARVVAEIGSPVYLTVCGLTLFYLYGWFRRLPGAEIGFVASLLGLTIIGPGTVNPETLTELQVWPLAVAGLLELIHSIFRPDSRRYFVASVGCLMALVTGLWQASILHYPVEAGFHLLLVVMLVIGAVFKDEFALVLRGTGVSLLVLSCLIVAVPLKEIPLSESIRMAYVSLLTSVLFGYGWLLKEKLILYIGLLMLSAGVLKAAWSGYTTLERSIGTRAPAPLIWGTVCFLIAVFISAWKAGLRRKIPFISIPNGEIPFEENGVGDANG